MSRTALFVTAVLVLANRLPVAADVTINATVAGTGMGSMPEGQQVTFVKGLKMRTDMKAGGRELSTILDAGSGEMIMLDHRIQQFQVLDIAKTMTEMNKIIPQDKVMLSVTPTGNTKQMLGQSCEEHAIKITLPVGVGSEALDVVTSGTICVAKKAPGAAEYAQFYKAAAEKGLLFGNPQQAKAMPGPARGMAELHRAVSSLGGVPYSMVTKIRFEGKGPMAEMMNKMGTMGMTMEVTAVSVGPIPDDKFTVPAAWKKVESK